MNIPISEKFTSSTILKYNSMKEVQDLISYPKVYNFIV